MLVLRHRLANARGRPGAARGVRLICVEAALAAVAFAALCVLVLSFAPQLGVEPDDGAYRASIVAMTEGDFLTLSSAQVNALAGRLGDGMGSQINGSSCQGDGISARRIPAILSSRRRSRRSA
jgi:hypothetical protein